MHHPIAASVECDIFAVDPHIKTPYMENYNINIQQQITSKTTLQVGYVGSQGHRLFRFFDINQPSQARDLTDDSLGLTPAAMAAMSRRNDPGFLCAATLRGPAGVADAIYIFQEKSTGSRTTTRSRSASGSTAGTASLQRSTMCIRSHWTTRATRRLRRERGPAPGQQPSQS